MLNPGEFITGFGSILKRNPDGLRFEAAKDNNQAFSLIH